jgi:hypothetical protein
MRGDALHAQRHTAPMRPLFADPRQGVPPVDCDCANRPTAFSKKKALG